jgi:4'-phosphopantetheinyl transferase
VHVWLARLDERSAHSDVLSVDEQARAARFRSDLDRDRWVASRVLLRTVLARYVGVGPERLRLRAGPREKPTLRRPLRGRRLRFNLSHSGDLAICAVARSCEVGVDVEAVRSYPEMLDVAGRVLDDRIVRSLAATRADQRADQFFREWTRLESHGKCAGTGLVEPGEAPDAPAWIVDLDVGPGYAAALATSAPPRVVRRWRTAV